MFRVADSGKPARDLLNEFGDDEIFEEDSTAYACVRTIAETCGALKLRAVRLADGLPVDPGSGTDAAAFNRMMTHQRISGLTPYTFWSQVFIDLAKHGNAWVQPLYNDGRLDDLLRLPPGSVSVDRSESGELIYTANDQRLFDVRHIKLPSIGGEDDLLGTPPLRQKTRAMQLSLGGYDYVLKRLEKTMPPADMIVSDDPFTADEVKSLREIEAKGDRFATRFAGGAIRDIKSVGHSPQDTETRELREQSVQEIARRFGVPAPIIGLNITQWGSGVEALARMFYRFTLRAYLTNVEAAISTLFGRGFVAQFDVSPLLVPDTETKVQVSNALTGSGIATLNEVRKLWDLPAIDKDKGGDDLLSPTQQAGTAAQPGEEQEREELANEG